MSNTIRYIFILLLIAATGKSFAQFTCSINLIETPDTGCFPFPILAVPMEDTTSPVVSRTWTLTTCSGATVYTSPNGLNSTFSYEPTAAGCYCLNLQSVNKNGQTCTSQKCNLVEANPATISATFSPASICIGGTVTLSLQDAPSCGVIDTTYVVWPCIGIVPYIGNPSTVSETFPNNCVQGSYDVSVLVRNSCGCFTSKTYNNAITIVPSPIANFSADVTSGYCVNSLTSHFTATQQANGVTYCWYVNGAQKQCSASNLFTYTFPSSPNCYDVKLVVSQPSGCADSITQKGYICVFSTVAPTFTQNADSACVAPGSSTSFCVTTTTPGTATWTITGPGGYTGTGTGSNFCSNLTTAGFYNVTLNVSNGPGCNGSITVNNAFQVKTSVVPCFTLNDTFSCLANFCVTATNCTNPAAASYFWSFPGANPAASNSANPPQFCYTSLGQKSVTLQVNAGNGCTATTSQSITADTLIPVFIYNHVRGCAPLTVSFKSTTVTTGFPDAITNYTWSFPGANPPIAPQSGAALSAITQTFNNPGCYSVRLAITTASGCTSATQQNNIICTGTKPAPCSLTATPTVKCYDSLPVTFVLNCDSFDIPIINFGDGAPVSFGNNALQAVDSIKHTYQNCGTYSVWAIALRDSCPSDTLRTQITINCPFPNFYDSTSCRSGDTVFFINTSVGATRYHWNFSCSPDTFNTKNIKVDLPHCSGCQATLTAYNDSIGCHFYKDLPFTTSCNGAASFTPVDTFACNDILPVLINTTPNAGSGTTWFSFSTNQVCPITGGVDCYPGPIYAANSSLGPGIYGVTMAYYAPGGCIDTLFGQIHVCKLTANFTPAASCLPDSFYFMGSATDAFCDGKFKWSWNFASGTGGPANVQNPVVYFPTAGQYPVTLTVTDSVGCSASVTQNISIGTAVFDKWTFDTLICPNTPVCITNTTSSAVPLNENWFFPGGSNIDSFSGHSPPCIDYDSSGLYPIIYHVEAGTCNRTDTQYVDVHAPVPRAFVFQNFFPCPQAQEGVLFLDSSLYVNESVDSASWTFYDTLRHAVHAISHDWQPSVFFPQAGVYIATLCITTNTGCTVCANVDTIVVEGPYGTVQPSVDYACPCDSITFSIQTVKAIDLIFIAGCNQGFIVDSTLQSGTDQNPTLSSYKIPYCNSITDTCLPQLIIRDTSGCNVSILSIPVSIDSPTVNFNYSSFRVCDSGTVNFFDSTFYHLPPLPPGYDSSFTVSWSWNFGDGTSATADTSTLQNPAHYYSHPGTYQVKLVIESNFGCIDSITKTIIVYPRPTAAFALSDTSLCSNNLVCITNLSTGTVSVVSWVWSYGDSTTATGNAPPCHEYSPPYNPTYDVSLVVTDSNQCVDSSKILLKLNVGPTADFDWQVTCENQPMPFFNTSKSGNGAIDSCLYTFWIGAPSPKLDPNCNTSFTFPAGFYPVQFIVGDVNGCFDTIIKIVESDPLTKLSVQPADTTICIGNSLDYFQNGIYSTISWSPNIWLSYADSQNVIITPQGDVTYMVVAQSGVCPPASDSFTIIVVQTVPIGVNALPGTIVTGSSTQLTVDSLPRSGSVIEIDSVVWTPDSSLSCNGCLNPTASPTHTTTYTVTVYYGRNGYTCSRSEQVTVTVLSTCDSGTIFVPNTFSPNGDGVNDVFMIRGITATKIDYFRVYDRWGGLLFEIQNGALNDEQWGWNGTDMNGKKLNDGVYVYVYEVECINHDKISGKGNVTLLR